VSALLLSRIPDRLAESAGRVVPVLELGIGLALLADLAPRPGPLLAAGVLLTLFTAWVLIVVIRRLDLSCACFGVGGATIGVRTVLRNVVMLAIAAGGVALVWSADLTHSPSGWSVFAAIGVGLIAALISAAHVVAPALQLRPADEGGSLDHSPGERLADA